MICEKENVRKALKGVMANKGSPGVDGMTITALPIHLKHNWPIIRDQLLTGTYRPQPVKRVKIPKPDGGSRNLGVPSVLDRFVQQAVLQVLQTHWDPTFSRHSYGFRPKRSAHQAVAAAQQYIADGHEYVVDIDLEKFFDRVNHDLLMGRLARRIIDKRALKLIRVFLSAGVMENGLVTPTDEGTPQGGPLSPLLSNIVLDDLDRELERRGHRFVRYADDCNIYVRSEKAGLRVMESLNRFITRKLKLRINEKKSAVAKPGERKFLGFSFFCGRAVLRVIAPQSLERFRQRVRDLTPRNGGWKLDDVVTRLGRYLRGWRAYFGFSQAPWVLDSLLGWVRRRLRSLMWHRWKRGKTRFRELLRHGLRPDVAGSILGRRFGPWAASGHVAMQAALPNTYLSSLGLPDLTCQRV